MKRLITVTFKTSVFERYLIDQLCLLDGRNLSELLRELIRQESARRGIDVTQVLDHSMLQVAAE